MSEEVMEADTHAAVELTSDETDGGSTPPPSWLRRFKGINTTPAYMTGVLAALLVVFSVLNTTAFDSTANVQNLLQAASQLLVLSVGMTFVMVGAGLDLSIGSVLVFANVASALVMDKMGDSGGGTVLVGIIVALGSGLAWGLVNGLLITKARVPAIITTLGTFGAAQGLALVLSDGQDVRTVPDAFINFGVDRLFGFLPYPALLAIVVVVIAQWWLTKTRFGRRTYLVGSNAEASRRAGLPVDRHTIKLYLLSGLCAGVASLMSLATFATTTIDGHTLDNLTVITAVILGGTSLFGGVGTVLGTVIGVFIPTVLQDGFVIQGLQPFWQQVAIGVVLIVAVYVDQLKRRNRERG